MRPAASPQDWRALALSCLAGLALPFAGMFTALMAWPRVGLHRLVVEADPGPLAPVLVLGSAAVLAPASLRAGAAGDQAEGIGW